MRTDHVNFNFRHETDQHMCIKCFLDQQCKLIKTVKLPDLATCVDYYCEPSRVANEGHLLLGDTKGRVGE